ncbi:MAG: hypothetical protein ABI948_05600 [Thermoleophilia bacterium]
MRTLIALAALAVAAAPPVPLRAQRAIKQRTQVNAYVPARIPSGFRYYRWSLKSPGLRIVFRNKAGWEIVFSASSAAGCSAAGKEKSFQLDGNKVYWSHTETGQEAWRCVTGVNHFRVRLAASTTIPPTKFSDTGLGQVAAAGHYVR